MDYDITISRDKATAFVRQYGSEALLAALNMLALGERDLYSYSQDWLYVPAVKVIKARGTHGDVLVRLT